MESVKSFPWDAVEVKLPQPEVPTTPVLDLLSILGFIPLLLREVFKGPEPFLR